ncbi:hypothetical protein LCGC14_1213200 [marine sediment metagenome]|uniref:Uncharacterized protein n=1 Tax=marine sediment metagenome TaxID=412755 RepID=A0A0F9M0T5_9ZZZZ
MGVVQTGIPGVTADGAGNMNVAESLTALLGLAPASASVGVASAEVVAANADRTGLVLLNLSKSSISFGLEGAPAVLNSGITLLTGGAWTMDKGNFTLGAITAISDKAVQELAIQEFE